MDSGRVGELVGVVREVAAAPAGELSDAEVKAELVALRRLADAAEVAYLARLRVFDQRGISETEAALSTQSWVRHELHVAPAETSRLVKVAQRLADLPVIEAALRAGEIRLPHAAAIADAAALLGVDVIGGCQDALVQAARADEPTRLRAALRGLGAAVDNRRAVRRAQRRDQGRWLSLAATFDGAVAIDGVLPGGDESAAIVSKAIDSLSAPCGPDDERTPAQRRADALIELCRRQLNGGGLPARGGEPAQLTVVIGLDCLEARTGGFAELPGGGIIRGESARRLACEAKVSRLIVGPDSQPLDVGRAQRTVTPAQRKALRLRDGGCRFPGCDRPIEWTDTHHVQHWAHGGPTDLNNLISLCRTHHTSVHEGRWTITTTSTQPGQFTFIDPNGCPTPHHHRPTTTHLINQLITEISHPLTRAGPTQAGSTRASATRHRHSIADAA